MYWILFIMAAMVAVVVAAIAGGLVLPADHKVLATRTLSAPNEQVIALAADVDRWPEFSADFDARPLTLVERSADTVTVALVDDSAALAARWTVVATSDGATTRVRVTQQGRIGNPIVRLATHLRGPARLANAIADGLARASGP
jgi:hypothetical protein